MNKVVTEAVNKGGTRSSREEGRGVAALVLGLGEVAVEAADVRLGDVQRSSDDLEDVLSGRHNHRGLVGVGEGEIRVDGVPVDLELVVIALQTEAKDSVRHWKEQNVVLLIVLQLAKQEVCLGRNVSLDLPEEFGDHPPDLTAVETKTLRQLERLLEDPGLLLRVASRIRVIVNI